MLKDTPKNRIEIVELLRGIAALAVAWFHFTLWSEGWLKASGTYGWLGVEVFFVISGFIIPYSMFKSGYNFPAHTKTFLLKRIVRLEPPYIIAVLLTLILLYVSASVPGFRGPPPDVQIPQLLSHLGYLNAFLGYEWLSPVFWTLAIEFQFYICIAILFPLISHESGFIRLSVLTILCGLAFVITDKAFLFHFLGLFAMGIVTFWKLCGFTSNRSYVLMVLFLTVPTAICLDVPSAIAGLATSVVIGFVTLKRHFIFTFLGTISYSLYLIHVPVGGRVVNIGNRFSDSLILDAVVALAAVFVSLLAAYIMYKLIEQPAQKWSSAIKFVPISKPESLKIGGNVSE